MNSVEVVEVYSDYSALFRYRFPLAVLRSLRLDGSHYSPEFEIGGRSWRFHIGRRLGEEEPFVSLHLQSCSPGSVVVHFKLSVVCIRDPLRSKSKTFQCTFKKAGSAWGLHQFIAMEHLFSADKGYMYIADETGEKVIDLEVLLQIQNSQETPGSRPRASQNLRDRRMEEKNDFRNPSIPRRSVSGPVNYPVIANGRSPSLGASPRMTRLGTPNAFQNGVESRVAPYQGYSRSAYRDPAVQENVVRNPFPRAALSYPFEHLEALCDMTFDVQGVRVKAHRCVIGVRMKPLLPEQMLPLQVGCVVAIAVPLEVFTTFLRYVYTEEVPERGVLSAESLLDLYLLSSACEFYDLCDVCLQFVRPVLTVNNILSVVLTRYNAADDVLTALYLQVLLDYYDVLIQDPKFEEIPGHLFRRLSLILYQKETIRPATVPPMKQSLGKQLSALAESAEYSDIEWPVGPQKYLIRGHRFILASRSMAFAQAMNPKQPTPLPNVTTADFDFSLRSWRKLLIAIYQRHLDTDVDFSAEDVTIVFKMHTVLGLDGQLKNEADSAFSHQNALRVLVYAVKHQLSDLHDRAMHYVASNFAAMARSDPQVWELINELPQPAVVNLMRCVTEGAA